MNPNCLALLRYVNKKFLDLADSNRARSFVSGLYLQGPHDVNLMPAEAIAVARRFAKTPHP